MNMKIAYFDCFSGISGDMCLGALVDAGVALSDLRRELRKISLGGYSITSRKVLRSGIAATKVDVIQKLQVEGKTLERRKWGDIETIVNASSLPGSIKQRGLTVFRELFKAEAAVHGESFESVHLHELGGIDCIVDIFGTVIGLDLLGIEQIYISSINLGSGFVRTAHGMLPVPAPATIELLQRYPVYSANADFELTTPTGAALVSGLGAIHAPIPWMKIQRIGYGAGTRDTSSRPNTLRILLGDKCLALYDPELDSPVTVIETNIDDMNPQIYDVVMEKLFAAGALDVFLETIMMKKNRPAIKLSVMAQSQDIQSLVDILFTETTTIGVRFYDAQRRTLEREIRTIKTKYGDVRIKVSWFKGKVVNVSPEYEDLKVLSKKNKLPMKVILEEILASRLST